jgi:hypothetical protein
MGNTMVDALSEARQGNVTMLARLIVAGTAGGAAAEALKDFLFKRDDEPDETQFAFLKKLLGWQVDAGLFGLVGSYGEDFYWSQKRGEVVPVNVPLFEWWIKNVIGAGKAVQEGSLEPAYTAVVKGTPLFRAIDAQLGGPASQQKQKRKKGKAKPKNAEQDNPSPFD